MTRRCRGCGLLLTADRACPCDSATVHVVTDLGPTDSPGLIVPARLLGPSLNGHRIFYYDPFHDQAPRHTNNRCTVTPEGHA